MSWERPVLAVGLGALCVIAVLVSPLCAQREGDIPYSQASFEVSAEPTQVVLQLVTSGGLSGYSRSLTVYGDGQVDLHESHKGAITERHTIQLGPDGVRELLRPAIAQGVAEWHTETIEAWMRQRHPRIPDIADGQRVQISLYLSSYRRGEYQRAPLAISFRTKSPSDLATFYPDIVQFQGVGDLVKWFSQQWCFWEVPGISSISTDDFTRSRRQGQRHRNVDQNWRRR